MKNYLLFFASAIVGIAAISAYVVIKTKVLTKTPIKSPVQTSVISETPTPDFPPENAPSQTVRGNITSMAGEVNWQSRTATQSSEIISSRQIQQGEQMDTGANGTASVEFPTFTTLKISPNSQISFAQTLPVNFVFAQSKGTINYANTGIAPLSIRTLHLLVDLGPGEITTTVNSLNPLVTINVVKGKITVAYNDKDFVSQVKTFEQGQRFVFDDTTRQLSF